MLLHPRLVGGPKGFSYPHQIDNSIWLDGGDSLARTFTSETTWTLNVWFKLLPGKQLRFLSSTVYVTTGGQLVACGLTSTRRLRDVGWYNLHVNATGAWINGESVSGSGTFSMSAVSNPAIDGAGLVARFVFLDGQTEAYSAFSTTRSGILVPTSLSGLTYGTDGVLLDFANASDLGEDSSGNGNNWTATSMSAANQSTDTPTSNENSINPLASDSGLTIGEGGQYGSPSSAYEGGMTTYGLDPQDPDGWYWEVELIETGTNAWAGGIAVQDWDWQYDALADYLGYNNESWAIHAQRTRTYHGSSTANNEYTTLADGDIMMFALRNGKLYFGANGSWFGTMDPVTETSPEFSGITETVFIVPCFGSSAAEARLLAREADLNYSIPTGFKTPEHVNLAEPEVIDPSYVVDAVLYTGNGSSGHEINGLSFRPDFVWIKNRDATDNHMVYDVVRGATKDLHTNATDTEATDTEGLSSFDSDGFTVGNNVAVNTNTEKYVALCLKAGGAAVSNTGGSITSSVSAAPDGHFSIVGYTGTGAAATVGHGLPGAPNMIIIKNRDDGTKSWIVRNNTMGVDDFLRLDTDGAESTSAAVWNSTLPTSSVFHIGTANAVNTSGDAAIAYCFRNVPGLLHTGSYIGNGSADGPFVWCGFRPKWLMIKASSTAASWMLVNAESDPDNPVKQTLYANLSDAEAAYANYDLDFLSHGFKLRGTATTINSSGQTYIFLALAEQPGKYSNAR